MYKVNHGEDTSTSEKYYTDSESQARTTGI